MKRQFLLLLFCIGLTYASLGQSTRLETLQDNPSNDKASASCKTTSGCNLVQNGNFDSYSPNAPVQHPNNGHQIDLACFWDYEGIAHGPSSLIDVSGDYCHEDSTYSGNDVPNNNYTQSGYHSLPQSAKQSGGYAVIGMGNAFSNGTVTNSGSASGREYLGQTLTQTMTVGRQYFCSFFASIPGGQVSSYNGIGMQLNVGKPQANFLATNFYPSNDALALPSNQIHVLQSGAPISNYGVWNRVSNLVKPTSNYNYLTIGNLLDPYDPLFDKTYFPPTSYWGGRGPNLAIDKVEVYDVTIPSKITICANEDLSLDVLQCFPGASFYWVDGNGSQLSGLTQTIANANIASPYTFHMVIDGVDDYDLGTIDINYLTDQPPTIFGIEEHCVSDEPYEYNTNQSGGTWSSPNCANCIDPNTGVFTPSVAGAGNYVIEYTTANKCFTQNYAISVKANYTCCLDEATLDEAIILKGTYSIAPIVPSGSTVIIESDVVFSNVNLHWKDVVVYVDGKYQGMTITGSEIELIDTNASFVGCTFQSACDIMWKGMEVGNKSKLQILGTKVSDAYKGLEILDNTIEEITIEDTDFINNYYSIYFKTGELAFPIQIVESRFNSDNEQMKTPYNHTSVNSYYHTEAHLYFEKGMSKLFPFKFMSNHLYNSKYGLYSVDGYDFGIYAYNNEFKNCFAAGIHAKRTTTPWAGGNGATNDLLVHDSRFGFPNEIPATPQFSGISQTYGILQSAGDLEVKNCTFNGTEQPFLYDVGIRFYNPVYVLKTHNNAFNLLGTGIQVRAYGGHWLKLKRKGLTQKVSGGTDLSITSNTFIDNDEGIRFMSNNNSLGVILPPIPSGATNTSPCSNCPIVDIHEVNQTINCNEFIRKDGLVSTAISVENSTLMTHIGGAIPAGNKIVDPTNNMWSVRNLGSPFKYRHYNNENFGPNFGYSNSGTTFIDSYTLANSTTCPNFNIWNRTTSGLLITEETLENFSIKIHPNPTTGLLYMETNGFEKEKTIEVMDIYGKLVYSLSVSDNTSTIDLSKNDKGLYFVKISDDNKQKIKKVILK